MVSCRHSVFESRWDCCETNEESLDPCFCVDPTKKKTQPQPLSCYSS